MSQIRYVGLNTLSEKTLRTILFRICYLEEVTSDMQEAMKVARQSLCQNLVLDSGSVSSNSSSGPPS